MSDQLLTLFHRAESLKSREEFISFAADAAKFFSEFGCENLYVHSLLFAMSRWLEDTGEYATSSTIEWSSLAKILLASTEYE
jgi:hypothetical protein